jgi:hypothetical protein
MEPLSMTSAEGTQEAQILYMLEAGLDSGRRLLRAAQRRHFELGRPLPTAYRLLGPLIWQYDTASLDVAAWTPPSLGQEGNVLARTSGLPYHPFFRGWYVHGEGMAAQARSVLGTGQEVDGEMLRTWAAQVAQEHFDRVALERVRARLLVMGEWLWEAEQVQLFELTMAAAETVMEILPAQHPFTLSMAELGLNLMLYQLY